MRLSAPPAPVRGCSRIALLAVLSSIAPVSGVPAHAQEVGVGYTAALYVGRGTYPTDRVHGVYLLGGVDLTAGPVRASVGVPFFTQRTTPLVRDALSGEVLPATTSTGFGDPLIRGDVRLFQDRARTLQIGVSASLKTPVVDAASGRGTGEFDAAAGATVFKAIGRTSVFGDLLFWSYGDPEGIVYEDSVSYSVGVGRVLGSRWATMLSLAGFSRAIDGGDAPVQANVAFLRMAGSRQSVAVTVGAGLTDGSEDFSLGVSWRISP